MANRIAIWLEGKQDVDELAFMYFVLSANVIQKSVQFHFPDPPDGLSYDKALKRLNRDEEIYDVPFDVHVFLTSSPIEGNLFFTEVGPLVRVTSAGWERYFAPPSLFEYLMHSILCGVTFALGDDIESHDEFTMGCQFEYTRIKAHDRVDIALGYICPDHMDKIAEQISATYLADLLTLVSFRWVGSVDEPGTIASRLRAYFGHDLERDSGFQKGFWQRIRPNVDALWFDFAKELFKAVILIVTAFLLIKFGLKGGG